MKRAIFLVVVLLMVVTAMPASAGNGIPPELNGKHYNLNIHGVSNPKTADMTNTDGHSIFVPEFGTAKIMLSPSTEADKFDFQVTDANAFDGSAAFKLPVPAECEGRWVDTDGDGVLDDFQTPSTCTIRYTVWIRLLGKPNGSMAMYSCIQDPDLSGGYICSDPAWWVELTRSKGKSTFTNVSKELLFVSADVDADGAFEHVQLFDPAFDQYYWEYVNKGVKLAQLRFYMGDYCVDWTDGPTGSVTPGKCQ